MKIILGILVLGTIASFTEASPQWPLFFGGNQNGENGENRPRPAPPSLPPRPFSPLPPVQLPPYFQNLGVSLPPPPPPPLHFEQLSPLELGQAEERFFFNLFAQLFPFLRPSTTTTTTTSTTNTPPPAGK